jgi:small redox-active disulfide protein 2
MAVKTIEILGAGCASCRTLEAAAHEAVTRLGLACEVVKVTDIEEILRRGALMTPALAIDGKIRSSGKALRAADIEKLLLETSAP